VDVGDVIAVKLVLRLLAEQEKGRVAADMDIVLI
jgi:hypothetical protein